MSWQLASFSVLAVALLLVGASRELSADVRRGSRPLPDPLDFPTTVMDGANRRLAALPASTRAGLAAVAVLGTPTLPLVRRLLAALEIEIRRISGNPA